MKLRPFVAIVLCSSMTLLAAGCGDSTDSANSVQLKSAGSGSAKSSGSDSSSATSTDSGSSDSGSDSSTDSTDSSGSSDTSTDGSLPDLSGLGNLGDCMNIGVAYAGLAMSALGGKDGAKQAEAAVNQLKQKFPDLAKDFDVVGAAYAKMAKDGILAGGQEMDSTEFKTANDHIESAITAECDTSTTAAT